MKIPKWVSENKYSSGIIAASLIGLVCFGSAFMFKSMNMLLAYAFFLSLKWVMLMWIVIAVFHDKRRSAVIIAGCAYGVLFCAKFLIVPPTITQGQEGSGPVLMGIGKPAESPKNQQPKIDTAPLIKKLNDAKTAQDIMKYIKELLPVADKDAENAITSVLTDEDKLNLLFPPKLRGYFGTDLYKVLLGISNDASSEASSEIFVSLYNSKHFEYTAKRQSHSGYIRKNTWFSTVGNIKQPSKDIIAILKNEVIVGSSSYYELAVKALGRIGSKGAIQWLVDTAQGDSSKQYNIAYYLQEFRNRPSVMHFMITAYLNAKSDYEYLFRQLLLAKWHAITVENSSPPDPTEIPTYNSMPNKHAAKYLKMFEKIFKSPKIKNFKDGHLKELTRLKEIRATLVKKAEEYKKEQANKQTQPTE